MPRVKEDGQAPRKELLYEVGLEQEGYFTLPQANQAGFSRQLLNYLVQKGEVEKARRGIYRWAYFPLSEDGELIELWLWSGKEGIFSHETSLFLHRLSDALPKKVHMTLPESWLKRRLQLPMQLTLHYSDIDPKETCWFGATRTTKPLRTLLDCVEAQVNPGLVVQAFEESLVRGLFSLDQLHAESTRRAIPLPTYLVNGAS